MKNGIGSVSLSVPGCRDLGTRECHRELLAQTTAQTKPRFEIGNILRELWKMSKCCQERCLCCQLQEGRTGVVGTA